MSEQDKLAFWTKLLRLEGLQVVHERRDTPSDPVRLTVAPVVDIGVCPHCSRACDCVNRRLDSEPIHDLPQGPQAIRLIIRTPQFHCQRCDRYFTPSCPHVAPGAHATERFLEQAAKLIRFSDIANASAFLGVPEKNLERWYYDYVERKTSKPAADLKPIKSLGIDELSLKKAPAVRSGVHRSH
jgi:transposase